VLNRKWFLKSMQAAGTRLVAVLDRLHFPEIPDRPPLFHIDVARLRDGVFNSLCSSNDEMNCVHVSRSIAELPLKISEHQMPQLHGFALA
jgi:hypothetical protein